MHWLERQPHSYTLVLHVESECSKLVCDQKQLDIHPWFAILVFVRNTNIKMRCRTMVSDKRPKLTQAPCLADPGCCRAWQPKSEILPWKTVVVRCNTQVDGHNFCAYVTHLYVEVIKRSCEQREYITCMEETKWHVPIRVCVHQFLAWRSCNILTGAAG